MEHHNPLTFGIDYDSESLVELLKILQSGLEDESDNRTNAHLKSTLEPSESSEYNEDDSSDTFSISPQTKPIIMTVKALVHHPLDWSPSPKKRDEESMPKDNRDKLQQDDSGFVEAENSFSPNV